MSQKSKLLDAISKRVLLGDGAMGTQLQQAGLAPGGCGEEWNLKFPERVLKIQQNYANAGSDCLITNTFGGCRVTLERHGVAERVREINIEGAKIARTAFGNREGFVLGDMGPFGGIMEPLGDVPVEKVRDAFIEQAKALVEGGVDAIILETQTALEELELGISAAKQAGAPVIIASISYDVMNNGVDLRTMMGISPERAAKFAVEQGADIVALNCGTGIDMVWASKCVTKYRSTCALPTMAQPNSGLPVLEGNKVIYRQVPAEMARDLHLVLDAGVAIVGACCGSTPEHIRALRPLVDEFNKRKAAK